MQVGVEQQRHRLDAVVKQNLAENAKLRDRYGSVQRTLETNEGLKQEIQRLERQNAEHSQVIAACIAKISDLEKAKARSEETTQQEEQKLASLRADLDEAVLQIKQKESTLRDE